MFRLVIIGKGQLKLFRLALFHSFNPILEAGDEAAAAQLQHVILAGAALQGLAIDVTSEVNQGEITLLRLIAVDDLELGHAHLQPLDLLIHLGGGNLDHLLLGLKALIFPQLRPRRQLHRRFETEGLVLFLDGLEIHLRLVDGLDLRLADGGLVPLGQCVLKHLGQDGLLAEIGENNRPGNLPLAEAGDVHLAGHLPDGLVDAGLYLLAGNLHLQLDAVILQVLDAGFQVSQFSLQVRVWGMSWKKRRPHSRPKLRF